MEINNIYTSYLANAAPVDSGSNPTSLEEASSEQLTQFIEHLSSEADAGKFEWLPALPDLMEHIGTLMSNAEMASTEVDHALAELVERVAPDSGTTLAANVDTVALAVLTEATGGANPLDHAIMGRIDSATLKERPQLLNLMIQRLSPDYAYLLCLETDTEPPENLVNSLDVETRATIETAHRYNAAEGCNEGCPELEGGLTRFVPYLRVLYLDEATQQTIPSMPLLKDLTIMSGENLTQIGNMPNLEQFLATDTPVLAQIGEQPKCRDFQLMNSGIAAIPSLPSCESFVANELPNLTHIGDLQSCREFVAYELPALTTLPDALTACETFEMKECNAVAPLPALDACKNLKLIQLRSLSSIPSLRSLEILEVTGCHSLRELPTDLSLCTDFKIAYLYRLTALPTSLPACTTLTLRHVSSYVPMPEAPLAETRSEERVTILPPPPPPVPHTRPSGNPRSLQIVRTELTEVPADVLMTLCEKLAARNGKFPKVTFLGEEGIDAGGLKRDLVATLAQNLAANKAGQKLAFEKRTGGVIPKLVAFSGEKRETEIKHLRAFADLLAAVYRDDTVTIGNVLAPTFFEALSLLNNEEYTNDEIALRIAATDIFMPDIGSILVKFDPARRGAEPPPLTETELLTVQEWAEEILGDEAPAEKLQNCTKEVFKKIAAEALDPSQPLDAFIEVAKRLREALGPATWQQATQLPAAELAVKIQGSLEAKDISEKLSPIGSGDTVYNFAETDSSDEAKTFRNLKAWVEDTARTKKELKGFLKAMTASPALIPGEDLKIRLFHADSDDKLPTAHTCFFQLDLPTNYADDPALFEQKLKLFIDNAEGFQFA